MSRVPRLQVLLPCPASLQIESRVFERPWRIVGGTASDHAVEKVALQVVRGQADKVAPKNDGLEKLMVFGLTVHHDWSVDDVCGDIRESGLGKPRFCLRSIGKVPRSAPVANMLGERRLVEQLHRPSSDCLDIPRASALGYEPAAGFQGAMECREEAIVIRQPVECRRAENGIGYLIEWQIHEITALERDPIAKVWPEMLGGAIQHVGRLIHCDDMPVWEPLQQQLGQATSATPGVDYGLVATKREAFENNLAPFDMGIGDEVIAGGVPFAKCGWGRLRHWGYLASMIGPRARVSDPRAAL